MSLLHYIDNEVPSFGEWNAVVTAGSSTIQRSALASFPERGGWGLRATAVATSNAYVRKTVTRSVAPGEWYWEGFWCRATCPTSQSVYIMDISAVVGIWDGRILISTAGGVRPTVRHAGGLYSPSTVTCIVTSRWNYFAFGVQRSTADGVTDGRCMLYVNGQPVFDITGLDTYTEWATVNTTSLGLIDQTDNGWIIDFDEIKIGTTLADVEPYRPEPATECVEAARTLVLYRRGSADSVTFADYCVTQLGIPRANLVPLPNATGTETLAGYAAFQTQVENDLAAWLAANPTADANKMCFIVGYGVPGYFTDGTKVSATSRLMHYGNAYISGGKANPLYNPATVERITKTALDAAGTMLAVRIDAPTLAQAEAMLDAGLAVSALDKLPDSDMIFSSDTDYLDSLSCQKLRLTRSSNIFMVFGAFFYGTGSGATSASGSRAAWCDTGASQISTLRSIVSQVTSALFNIGWAGGIGFAGTAGTFDAGSFFEMLRIGGTFAEAAAVAVAKVDYTAVVAGEPLMTVSFPKHGHNIYKGIGGVESIDWSSPAACLRQDQTLATLKTTLTAGQRHIYAARAVSEAGIEEKGNLATTFIEVDGQGTVLSPPLSAPFELTAAMQTDGSLLVSFSHETGSGENEPESFELLSDFGTGEIDTGNPVATLSDNSSGQSDFEILVGSPTLPAMFAVRGICEGQAGPTSEIIFVQSPHPPQPPTPL